MNQVLYIKYFFPETPESRSRKGGQRLISLYLSHNEDRKIHKSSFVLEKQTTKDFVNAVKIRILVVLCAVEVWSSLVSCVLITVRYSV